MDFDTTGVVSKFEEHWGRGATKALLMLVALGIAATCLGAIWQWIALPLLQLVQASPAKASAASFVLRVIGIAAGIAAGGWLAAILMRVQGAWRIRGIVAEGYQLLKQAERTQLNSVAFLDVACLAAKAAIEIHQGLTPEQRAKSLDAIKIAEELVHLSGGDLTEPDVARIEALKVRAQRLEPSD